MTESVEIASDETDVRAVEFPWLSEATWRAAQWHYNTMEMAEFNSLKRTVSFDAQRGDGRRGRYKKCGQLHKTQLLTACWSGTDDVSEWSSKFIRTPMYRRYGWRGRWQEESRMASHHHCRTENNRFSSRVIRYLMSFGWRHGQVKTAARPLVFNQAKRC